MAGRIDDGGAQQVDFGDGRRALLVRAHAAESPSALLVKLGLTPHGRRSVIVVCGGADDLREPQLTVARNVLGPAVRAAAARVDVAVVDGGTTAGVMGLIGAERGQGGDALPVLVGVAPAGQVSYPGAPGDGRTPLEPHHSHFVLAESSEWGGETGLLVAVAEQLAGGAPIAMVLAGGGRVARREALAAVTCHWPLFVIEGTGGCADEIAALWRRHREPRRRSAAAWLPPAWRHAAPRPVAEIDDPQLRLIVTDGDVRRVAGADVRGLARSLAWVARDAPALKDAWVLFATYDRLAGLLRTSFSRFQGSILLLGLLATLLALIDHETGGSALRWVVVGTPIVVSVLIALTNHRASGKRWVLLRAAAEAIKSEIYRYRTATGAYAIDPGTGEAGRRRQLLRQLDEINERLFQSEASSGPLSPYDGPLPPAMYGAEADDDGLSPIDAERYVTVRVSDQLTYYRGRIRELDRRRAALQLITFTAGGAGALLAAVGLEIWIGLSTALSGAALAHLTYLQVDNTIIAYNQSASRLASLEREFRAGDAGQESAATFDELVMRGEAVLTTELGGWVKQMTDAMRKLQEQQSKTAAPEAKQPAAGEQAPLPGD
jgi:hypothetical protein